MEWEYIKNNNCWMASRPYGDNCSEFVYTIYGNNTIGYTAEAYNTAYGADRVAVENIWCEKESLFYSLDELKERIENGTQLWLYTGYCNCIGEVTTKEY